ncbi:peptidase T, partial [Enterobacter hormaechei]
RPMCIRERVTERTGNGMRGVTGDEFGYVMETHTSNKTNEIPVAEFLAHLDTAKDITGNNVQPKVHENDDGKDIVLNKDLNVVLSPKQFPELADYKGKTLITTDGTTLLGADDKAGITEIMVAMNHLINHPEIKHGKIRVAFTPDEEIGRGPERFDVEAFGAKDAYTMDG